MAEIPEYAAWMFEDDDLDEPRPKPPAHPPRRLSDLPIFGAFWAADGADLSR